MKNEAFKKFVRTKPELIKYVQSGQMTWQKFYELYDLYGEDEKIWNKYILNDERNITDSISKITNIVKNVKTMIITMGVIWLGTLIDKNSIEVLYIMTQLLINVLVIF